jgi:hypothetical protein
MRKSWKTRMRKVFAASMTAALVLSAAVIPAAADEADAAGELDLAQAADIEAVLTPVSANISAKSNGEEGTPLGGAGLDINFDFAIDPNAGAQSASGTLSMSGINMDFSEYADKDALLVKIPGIEKVLSFSFSGIEADSVLGQMIGADQLEAFNHIMDLFKAEIGDPEAMQKYAEEFTAAINDIISQFTIESADPKEVTLGGETVTCNGMKTEITAQLAKDAVNKILGVTLPNGQTIAEYAQMLINLKAEGETQSLDAVIDDFFADMPNMDFLMYMTDEGAPAELSLAVDGQTMAALQFRGPQEATWTEIAFVANGEDMAVLNVTPTEAGISAALTVQGQQMGTLDVDLTNGTFALEAMGYSFNGSFAAAEDGSFVITVSAFGLDITVTATTGGTVTKPEGDVLELTTMTEEDFNAIAQSLGGLFGGMAPAAQPAA